jgi:hypothetical protein
MSDNKQSQQVFSNIYENFGFGSTEARSGPGSTLAETEKLRIKIIDLIKKYNIKSITDFPCGDLNWMQHIFEYVDKYSGCDIVEECITTNKSRFSNLDFYCLDLSKDTIPTSDLLIVRDVIGHQPIDVGIQMINNIINSNCKYLLSTTWAVKDGDSWRIPSNGSIHRENEGVDFGRFYPVNLMSKPFNLPSPDLCLEEDVVVDGFEEGNRKVLAFWEINKLKPALIEAMQVIQADPTITTASNKTIVTGLWNINRPGRDFNHYIEAFKRVLDIPQNLFIYIPKEYEYLVWEKRSPNNTYVRIYEIDDVKRLYDPFWSKTQHIRTSEDWLSQAGWLRDSPQATLEMYNPIVQSKMFMLNDASIMNPFDTEYLYWVDAGITNTVPHGHLAEDNVLDKLSEYSDPFLFLSYPYIADKEIHGFDYQAMNRISENEVKYVCRGGIFGGQKQAINNANATYYSLLDHTLAQDLMGTEESIFTIMSYTEPSVYRRFELDENGLIVKFTQAIKENTVTLSEATAPIVKQVDKVDYNKIKTNLYMLTFNFPEQVLHTIESMKKTPEWLTVPKLVLLDNSTDNNAKIKNQEVAKEYNFEYIDLGGNTGICGGRQAAAEHFNNSDADFMFFFEDDMTSNPPELEGQVCRNGFRKYIPNLYNIVHKIMLEKEFDFLKLSFTEVYFDNDKQCSWYNVPQTIRTRDWPEYDKLPITGLDNNCPRTNFNHIYTKDDLSYVTGEVYYANWPMIVSREGNKKMFIDTTWAHPYEQTWMSHIYQLTKEEKIRPAILLASPIWHDRIHYYKPEERRES